MNEHKEITCISISCNEKVINKQIEFLKEKNYDPIIKDIEGIYFIKIYCGEKELSDLVKILPFNETFPYNTNNLVRYRPTENIDEKYLIR